MKRYQNPEMTVLFTGGELYTDVLSVSSPNGEHGAREVNWNDFLNDSENG